MNSEYESYDESTDENIQIIKKDMEGDEKRSSGSSPPKHVCGSILEKLEQTKEQMQQTRKKSSNKVGVEMPSDVDCSWDRPPPCPSARFRVASGASQFREVNFSVAVGGVGARAKVEPEDEAEGGEKKVESGVFGSTQNLPKAEEEEEVANAGGDEAVAEAGEEQAEKRDPDDAGDAGDAEKKDPDDAGDNGDAEKAGTSSEGEKEDSASRVGEDVEKTVDDKGGRRSETKYEIVGADLPPPPELRASGSGGAVARRLVQVPQSLNLASNGALEAEFLRFSSGASTSKCGDPRGCQASLGGSMTEDTELSCGSTRSLGDEERKPPKPPKDDRVRPVLTATSLAIYTNIEQNGSRSGTCLLCTTAVCTFIVTMVLAVGILIAPKTLAVKEPPRRPLPDPPPPEPPALPANASSETPSVAALRGLTITRTQRARQGGGREHASSTLSLATTPPATPGRPPATVSMHLVSPTASATPSSARHTGYTLKFLRPSAHSPYRETTFSPPKSPSAAIMPTAGLSSSALFRKMTFPSLSSGVTSPPSSLPESPSPPSSPDHFPPPSSPADAPTTLSSSSRQTQDPFTAHTPPLTHDPETSSARNTTAMASSSSPPSGYSSPTTTILPPTAAGRERKEYLTEERVLLSGKRERKEGMN